VISTRTMQIRLLRTRTMPNEVAKHKNNLMRLLSKRTIVNEVAKHMHNGK